MLFLLFLIISSVVSRPQTSFNDQQLEPVNSADLRSGINDLATGARTTAFLIDEGGNAGLDILNQFGQLFRKFVTINVGMF